MKKIIFFGFLTVIVFCSVAGAVNVEAFWPFYPAYYGLQCGEMAKTAGIIGAVVDASCNEYFATGLPLPPGAEPDPYYPPRWTSANNYCTVYDTNGSILSGISPQTSKIADACSGGNYCAFVNPPFEPCDEFSEPHLIYNNDVYVSETQYCYSNPYNYSFKVLKGTGQIDSDYITCCEGDYSTALGVCPSSVPDPEPALDATWADGSTSMTVTLTPGQTTLDLNLIYWNAGDVGSILNVTDCSKSSSPNLPLSSINPICPPASLTNP